MFTLISVNGTQNNNDENKSKSLNELSIIRISNKHMKRVKHIFDQKPTIMIRQDGLRKTIKHTSDL